MAGERFCNILLYPQLIMGRTPLLAISALSGQTEASSLFKKRRELSIVTPPSVLYSTSRIQDVVRLLIEEGDYDPMDTSTTGFNSLNEYSGPIEPFEYMVERQKQFLIDFKHFSIQQHNDLAWSLADQFWQHSAELLLIALKNDLAPNVIDSFQPVWNRYRSCKLLHVEANRLDRYRHKEWPLEPSLGIITKYVELGADLHARDSFESTPLDDILSYKGKVENEVHKANVLSRWLQLLKSLKVDVDEYLAQEELLHESGVVVHVKHYRPNVERVFKVERSLTNTTITVFDVETVSESNLLPGSWVEGWGGFEKDTRGRNVCRNSTMCPQFSVSLA